MKSRSPSRPKRFAHARRAARRLFGVALGYGTFAMLGLAALACALAVAGAIQSAPVSSAAGPGTEPDVAGQDWTPLRSAAPADILDAARRSPLLAQQTADGDASIDVARLGTPVLVRGLSRPGSAATPDFYVIPALDRSGRATDAVEMELNAAHTAGRVVATLTFARPRRDGGIARMSASQAVARVARARHTAPQTDAQPRLIYFPMDAQAQVMGKLTWKAGGEFPADPLWLVPAADGREYVVGTNGKVYTISQLPIAASA
jgi:hypothetical protein